MGGGPENGSLTCEEFINDILMNTPYIEENEHDFEDKMTKVEVKKLEVGEKENKDVDMDMEPELEVKDIENEVEVNNDDVELIIEMDESEYAQVEIDLTMQKVSNILVTFYISLSFISLDLFSYK